MAQRRSGPPASQKAAVTMVPRCRARMGAALSVPMVLRARGQAGWGRRETLSFSLSSLSLDLCGPLGLLGSSWTLSSDTGKAMSSLVETTLPVVRRNEIGSSTAIAGCVTSGNPLPSLAPVVSILQGGVGV